MRNAGIIVVLALACGACGASYPPPTQRLSDAVGALHSAEEAGSGNLPQAQLFARLSQEEIDHARELMRNGDNQRADYVLVRAKADAELTLALTRQRTAEAEAMKTIQEANALRTTTPPTEENTGARP